jgi:hypothetical protein
VIDDELRRALDVNPSPEFLARVRSRIASEPTRNAAWLRLMPLAATVTAVTVALVVATSRRSSPTDHASPVLASRALDQAPAAMLPHEEGATSPGPEHRPSNVSRVAAPDARAASSAILVDPREAEALEKLIRTAPLRREAAIAERSIDEPIQIEPIARIQPIVIAPLEWSGSGERP